MSPYEFMGFHNLQDAAHWMKTDQRKERALLYLCLAGPETRTEPTQNHYAVLLSAGRDTFVLDSKFGTVESIDSQVHVKRYNMSVPIVCCVIECETEPQEAIEIL